MRNPDNTDFKLNGEALQAGLARKLNNMLQAADYMNSE